MTREEFAGLAGAVLVTALLTVLVWRRHGFAGVQRVVPGFFGAAIALGAGFFAARLIGPEWFLLVTLLVGLALWGIAARVAPRLLEPSPGAAAIDPQLFRRPIFWLLLAALLLVTIGINALADRLFP